MPECVHCHKERRKLRNKGLCNVCYKDTKIRQSTAATSPGRERAYRPHTPFRETLADLESLIESRRSTMPKESQHEAAYGVYVPVIVQRMVKTTLGRAGRSVR